MRTLSKEWPTWVGLLFVYCAWLALIAASALLHWAWLAPGLALLVAFHGSLQHESIHGHPTRNPTLNMWLAHWGLGVLLPYGLYRESHLNHHSADIAHPKNDPESFYVSAQHWERLSPLHRGILWFHQTLLGRLLIGPMLSCWVLLRDEFGRVVRGDFSHVPAWLLHVVALAPVLAWLSLWNVSILIYVLTVAYPAAGLTLLRSYVEHSSDPKAETNVVVSNPLFGLLYLNNNLHPIHHNEPWLAWYEIPKRFQQQHDALAESKRVRFFDGYTSVAARYLLRPKDSPIDSSGGGH